MLITCSAGKIPVNGLISYVPLKLVVIFLSKLELLRQQKVKLHLLSPLEFKWVEED